MDNFIVTFHVKFCLSRTVGNLKIFKLCVYGGGDKGGKDNGPLNKIAI